MNPIIDLAAISADMSILALGPVLFGANNAIISYMKGKDQQRDTNTNGTKSLNINHTEHREATSCKY